MIEKRKCIQCNNDKDLCETNYSFVDKNKKNFRKTCKICAADNCKKYYEANKAILLEKQKKYNENRKEELKKYNKQYYEENKEKWQDAHNKRYTEHKDEILIYQKKYYEANKEEIAEYKREYYDKNKEKLSLENKARYEENKNTPEFKVARHKYYEENKEKLNKQNAENSVRRREEDPVYRMRCIVSHAINLGLKSNGSSKAGDSCIEYLNAITGTDYIEALWHHLENLFEPWMTRDNQGPYIKDEWDDNNPITWKWNLDHIILHSKFNYISMKDEDFKKCWALENLRPLSAKQNIQENYRTEEQSAQIKNNIALFLFDKLNKERE